MQDDNYKFDRIYASTSNDLQSFKQKMQTMRDILDQMQNNPFSTDYEHVLQQQKEEALTLVNEIADKLKVLNSEASSANPALANRYKHQNESLVNEFSKSLGNFQKFQRNLVEVKRHTPTGENEPMLPQSGGGQLLLEDSEQLEREEQTIYQLERDIGDVNMIFKNLAMMVHEQGAVIDTIESNIEDANENVQLGTQQVSRAREFKKKYKRKCLCLIISVLVIVGIIIAVLVSKNNK